MDRAALRLLSQHALGFIMPVATLFFLLTAPHPGWTAALWVAFPLGSVLTDVIARPERTPPPDDPPAWPFDLVLYALVLLQVANFALFVRLWASFPLGPGDMAVSVLMVGVTSGYSGIVVAHELIHRPSRWHRTLGRLLLSLVLYEHFYTEHVRGHHKRVATPRDPATARIGETYREFYRRTVRDQFRSAWRLEAKRLGDPDMPWYDRRLLRSRVVHGLAFEGALLLAVALIAGLPGVIGVLGAQWIAIHLLEGVNYMEHWGLTRQERRVRPQDSWDADSWFTRFTLVGLSRHADHHAHASRPYPELRLFDESPKMPRGYFGTIWLVFFNNDEYRRRASAELERRGLGPYSTPTISPSTTSTSRA